jgi:CheY-like chemotaxis protein
LHGYRIPGSKDRRIPLNQLIRFMKQHGMPLNGLMTGCTRVMSVDDEQDIVEVLEKILEDEAKYEVEVAGGGFAAGVTAEKFRPHVILLDMHLSDIDAPEVARQVKKNADLQLTKVIAMSGKLTEQEAQGLLQGGFDGFLRKPFHVRQVIEAIEDATAVVY